MATTVNQQSLYCVLQLISATWADVALIDKQVLQYNVSLMSHGGADISERMVPKKRAYFLLDNYYKIFMAMILSNEYRHLARLAVDVAMMTEPYDDGYESPEFRNSADSKNFYINLARYDKRLSSEVINRIVKSNEAISKYYPVIDYAMSVLTEEDRLDIGYCISNLHYFIRAFVRCEEFVNDTKDYMKLACEFGDEVLVELEKAKQAS